MEHRKREIKPTMSVANNGVSVIVNTTQSFADTPSSTGRGDHRLRFAGHRLVGRIKVGDQAVTWSAKRWSDGAWVADLDSDIADGTSLTASTSYDVNELITGDVVRYTTNGATGPDDLDFDGYITSNPDPGGAY